MVLRISSTTFGNGKRIPEKHAHDQANLSAPLAWRGAPRETQSLVLVVEAEDAPHGTFYHWTVYDIPAGCSHLHGGAGRRGTEFRHGAKNYGSPSYDAPLPPAGGGIHRRRFRLAALDVPYLTIEPAVRAEVVWRTARDHVLKQAELVGTYEH